MKRLKPVRAAASEPIPNPECCCCVALTHPKPTSDAASHACCRTANVQRHRQTTDGTAGKAPARTICPTLPYPARRAADWRPACLITLDPHRFVTRRAPFCTHLLTAIVCALCLISVGRSRASRHPHGLLRRLRLKDGVLALGVAQDDERRALLCARQQVSKSSPHTDRDRSPLLHPALTSPSRHCFPQPPDPSPRTAFVTCASSERRTSCDLAGFCHQRCAEPGLVIGVAADTGRGTTRKACGWTEHACTGASVRNGHGSLHCVCECLWKQLLCKVCERYVLERCSAGALDTALLLTACAADWRACSVILWHALDECVIIEVGSNIQSTRVSYSVGLATVVASVRGFELSWSEGVLP